MGVSEWEPHLHIVHQSDSVLLFNIGRAAVQTSAPHELTHTQTRTHSESESEKEDNGKRKTVQWQP